MIQKTGNGRIRGLAVLLLVTIGISYIGNAGFYSFGGFVNHVALAAESSSAAKVETIVLKSSLQSKAEIEYWRFTA
ncbi:hypothetical protein [Paenibacillus sp. LHD-38]|uniref:hypothetical protein n=1 Tax=Paenibacillus sp. LHD-38 TaxID=3072143 RepID=UPI00280E02F4|nr:hypothetical protein [Paenibacillus sp. LHD-38]MDQ8739465.1 hypothetical protein [Paenibacillus sp. LHD-38]